MVVAERESTVAGRVDIIRATLVRAWNDETPTRRSDLHAAHRQLMEIAAELDERTADIMPADEARKRLYQSLKQGMTFLVRGDERRLAETLLRAASDAELADLFVHAAQC